jgi:DNA repair protein RecO (recombination protein O)
MEWNDEGVVLGVRRHGEASAIAELMTRAHGRHLGLVRGGAGSRMRPVLQPGNRVAATWRARLDEHLGNYVIEGLELRAASFLSRSHALYGVTHLGALCRLLPERDPHAQIHGALSDILDHLVDARTAAVEVARFELQLLAEFGFGLDLSCCAATGTTEDLVYVSPKSGRAVSRQAGAPWADKLFRLPEFLKEDAAGGIPIQDDVAPDAPAQESPTQKDLADGYRLTGYFLLRHVFEPRGETLPDARGSFVNAVLAA